MQRMMSFASQIDDCWQRLLGVQTLQFTADSKAIEKTGWSGSGTGQVRVEPVDATTLLFHERGTWTPQPSTTTIAFSNVFRWTLLPQLQHLQLEHLRFGPEQPVFLFALQNVGGQAWQSIMPHACRDDCYAAQLEFAADAVQLTWTVTGPLKDERIAYHYQ